MKNRKNRGFLLVESLISITILVMVTVTGISLLILGKQAINFNEHSLEASLLTQEATNALRGLRDTNWLRFGYDKATCWKMIGDDCTTATPIAIANYRIDVSPTGAPVLTSGTALNLADGADPSDEFYRLYYKDLDPALDVNERFVGHDGAVGEQASPFYRTIEVTESNDNHIEAVCSVQWFESGKLKDVAVPITLTNYLLET